MGKLLDSPASFRPNSLTFCVSKLFKRIILSHLLFFLESNSILSRRQDGIRPGRFLLPMTSPKLSILFGTPPFSTNLFQLAFLVALLFGLNLSFLTDALAWFSKITKVTPFESIEVFCKDPFLALYPFLFHQ